MAHLRQLQGLPWFAHDWRSLIKAQVCLGEIENHQTTKEEEIRTNPSAKDQSSDHARNGGLQEVCVGLSKFRLFYLALKQSRKIEPLIFVHMLVINAHLCFHSCCSRLLQNQAPNAEDYHFPGLP